MSNVDKRIAQVFQASMEHSYSAMRARGNVLTNLVPSKALAAKTDSGGYIVALRHPPSIIQQFSKFTAKLGQGIQCIQYNASNAHTTLATFGEGNNFKKKKATLERLKKTVAAVDAGVWQKISIDFRNWLLNEDALLVGGYPTSVFGTLRCSSGAKGHGTNCP